MGEGVNQTRQPNSKLRRQRQLRGWSLDDVTEALSRLAAEDGHMGPDRNTYGRWERGVRRPKPRNVRLLCRLFNLSADDLGLVPGIESEEASEAQERLRRVIQGPLRAHMQVVGHLRNLLSDWRVLDDLLGPRAMLPLTLPVCQLLDELSQDAQGTVRNALLTCGAEYQHFTGWLWVDLGDHQQASSSYERAIARAVQGNRGDLAGYLLACQAEHAIAQDRPRLARSLAEAAQARRHELTPAAAGWAADLEARTCDRGQSRDRPDPTACSRSSPTATSSRSPISSTATSTSLAWSAVTSSSSRASWWLRSGSRSPAASRPCSSSTSSLSWSAP